MSDDGITYQQAEPADAGAVAAVWNRIAAEDEPTGIDAPTDAAGVQRLFQEMRGAGAVFLARAGAEPAGFSLVEPVAGEGGAARVRVYVAPEQRLRGIGRELARMAIRWARDYGYKKVKGYIPEGNEAALSFYSSLSPLVPLDATGVEFELPL
ncbi:MAG TPA: GNAT family N-acetyltransferase [Dehalococcoidia bacterium]